MIVCTDCGYHNDNTDEFCGSCGAFLEWAGERVEAPAPPTPEPEPAPEEDDTRPGLVQRVKTAIAGDESTSASTAPPAEPAVQPEPAVSSPPAPPAPPDPSLESAAPRPDTPTQLQQPTGQGVAPATVPDPGDETDVAASTTAVAEDTRERTTQIAGKPEATPEGQASEARPEIPEPAAEPDSAPTTSEPDEKDAERARRAAALVAKPPPPAPPRPTRRRSTAVSSPQPPTEPPVPPPASEALGPQQPAAVKPAPPKARPAKKTSAEPEPTVRDGDLICGQCGTGNDSQRRFCRRCGASLAEAEVAKLSWWQRRKQRRKQPMAAGERRSRKAQAKAAAGKVRQSRGRFRRVAGKVTRIVALLAVLGIVGLAVGPMRDTATDMGSRAWEKVSQVFPKSYDPVHPVSAEASSSAEGHPPTHAIDTAENTFWAEGAEGTGEGQSLALGFGASPVDIDRVVVFSGAAGDEFVKQPRPNQLRLVFSDGTTADVALDDTIEQQDHPVEARQVTGVEIQILSVHPGTEGSAAAINDVEFRVKR